mmetsp:Transcript_22698/g.36762  ORF Transcript_22698/g.36762 Transcript_22698/m.36762 type:complete len:93 (+) Transcript_22698:564-842(+)
MQSTVELLLFHEEGPPSLQPDRNERPGDDARKASVTCIYYFSYGTITASNGHVPLCASFDKFDEMLLWRRLRQSIIVDNGFYHLYSVRFRVC